MFVSDKASVVTNGETPAVNPEDPAAAGKLVEKVVVVNRPYRYLVSFIFSIQTLLTFNYKCQSLYPGALY